MMGCKEPNSNKEAVLSAAELKQPGLQLPFVQLSRCNRP
jgi:hypothetical protein